MEYPLKRNKQMKREMLTAGLFLTVSVLNAQEWQPKTWQKYVIEQKVKSDTLCPSQTIMTYRRADDVKIAPQAFRCGPFYVPDPPSLFAEQEKALERARWEDRDYTFGQAMGEVFLEFVGNVFVGALDNLLFKKR
ncbi:MAG: hypothetical protein HXN55_06525 [Prevotella nigrescens]|uniref:Uncharacterized protein n=2 Tax=Prevotella nigrescens TaxID=28133 RepID=A0A9D6A7S6_9BACT|nr:hypothetical protein [Prevotella nigrescens]